MPSQTPVFGTRAANRGGHAASYQGPSSPPPTYYTVVPQEPDFEPRETEPLLERQRKRRRRWNWCYRTFVALLTFGYIAFQLGVNYQRYTDPDFYDPEKRAYIRQQWEIETTEHRRLVLEMQEERLDFEKERLGWAKLREAWIEERRRREEDRARREREEEERKRGLIHWGPLRKDAECLRYGTVAYRAVLDYTPLGYDPLEACRETPVDIHGRMVHANECYYNRDRMMGVWIVDFNEPACKPWWGDTKDHGCTSRGSGLHRYEAHLEGYLESNEFKKNWAEMCGSTPQDMFGVHYNSPTECAYWPKNGVYGFWDVKDSRCL